MKKFRNIFFVLLVSLIIFNFNDVDALSKVKVGNIDINDSETKNIYGGVVSFADGILTLDHVNINEMYVDELDNYHSIYNYGGDINIKLVGVNTITATYTGGALGSYYYGISSSSSSDSISIIGDGTLNYNVKDFCYNYLISSDNVNLGTTFFEQGPTLNINLKNNTNEYNQNVGIAKINNVIRTNIIINADNTYNFEVLKFNEYSDILASNIYFYGISFGSTKVINNDNFVQFRNCNMFIKTEFNDSIEPTSKLNNIALSAVGTSANQTVRFKNARCYIESPVINDNKTDLLLVRDEGEIDTYLAGKINGTLSFDGVLDEHKYSSKTTKDLLQAGYDASDLVNYKYLYFNSIEYLLVSGDDQDIESDSIFTFKVNVSPVLLKNMLVDNVILTSSDYTYDYNDGTVTFTDNGINKIKTLGDGEHTVYLNYQSGKTINVNFTFTNTDPEPVAEDLVNPQTFDNLTYDVVVLLLSLISLTLIVNYKKKSNF